MNDFTNQLKSKILKLFSQHNFEKIELEIEKIGELSNLPLDILNIYALSKARNPKSNKKDLNISADIFEKIYLDNNKNFEPLLNLSVIGLKLKKYSKILNLLNDAFSKDKKNSKLIEGLAVYNFLMGNTEKSSDFYKLLFELNPKRLTSRDSYISSLNYNSNITQNQIFEECCKFRDLMSEQTNSKMGKIISKGKKIDLAFYSSDIKNHSVGYFFKDLVLSLNKELFNISIFSNLQNNSGDDLTNKVKKYVDNWYDIYDYNDDDLINFIKSKNIHAIIDLNGFTSGGRPKIFAKRSAPIQISWLGYCNTVGLKNMDFIITDLNCIKKNEQKYYSEKIIYMPKIWNVLSKPKNLPDINDLPFLKTKIFTFGSFNNFEKISQKVIQIWSELLTRTNSRLILKDSMGFNEDRIENIKKKFLENGVNDKKLLILDFKKDNYDHLSLYNEIDLSLDTFPYNGVTTSFESLLMGVPVLTVKGFNFNSRCGESINLNMNLNNFIAKDQDDYLNKAVNFIDDIYYLKKLRKNLRTQVLKSPLFDIEDFSLAFQKKIKDIFAST